MTTPATTDVTSRLMSPMPLPTRTIAGVIIAVLAIVLMALSTYRALESREVAATRVTQTLQILEGLQSLHSSLKDAETGQRGFLLSSEERYLEPYVAARAAVPSEFTTLRKLMSESGGEQLQRLETLERISTAKLEELEQTIQLSRAGEEAMAIAIVRSDRGKNAMDQVRSILGEMKATEDGLLAARQQEWQDAVTLSSRVTWGGSILLLLLIAGAVVLMSRDFQTLQTQNWLRTGHMGLAERLQGEQRLEQLGEKVLDFLASYLGAQVGVAYFNDAGSFRRFASYATAAEGNAPAVLPGDGLLGQAARERRVLHVTDVPAGYLTVTSQLGRATPTEILIAPATVDRVVYGVLELGFFRRLSAADLELLERASESLGVAVRSSRDRTRLEELLGETQRQAEELQTQQEELRVNNEELEEQGRVLRESQVRLETQQAELEQINSHLEEQTQRLEDQKSDLADAQAILTGKAAELERANQYKSEFLANMSHELRTPLNSSLILAKVLADNREGNLTAEQIKFAQTISSAGNDLLALINDILDLSKIEAGKLDVTAEAVNVRRAVDSAATPFKQQAQEKKLSFIVQVESGTPERVETDAQRVGQILRNLLSNAFKFTERGEVSLRVFAQGSLVSFAVRDTGIGIPAHQQDVIFEAFRQADGSTHRKYGGTGLGLSISRDLARLLGGELTVQSAPGEGSVFTLTLPQVYTPGAAASPSALTAPDSSRQPATARDVMSAADPRPATTAAPTVVRDDRDRLTPGARVILIIEDDVRFADIMRDLAHELGFQCIVTHSASDGLAAAVSHRPNAIVLDINLPDYSGLGVLDQLKRNPETRHIPVHVCSVADYMQQALERGAVGYALKPVKREQLVDAFHQLEAKFSQTLRHVLVVEDDARQRESIRQLLDDRSVEITTVENGTAALEQLAARTFDCMVMDLNLPDLSGYELLEKMAEQDAVSFPPVIVYTGRSLTRNEEQQLRRFSKSIIIKDARSPERLLDEVTLFLHQVESKLPIERQRMLKMARDRESMLEGRRILVVEDDVRNIFALSSVLEPKGATIEIARNGREAIEALTRSQAASGPKIDLVLMDIMMPEMDGFTAMREIRKRAEWKRVPIIALTAKAMKDDQEKCLAAGANDYIAKPLDVEKLLSLVRVWMPK
jgi:CheY-like chemotaxis protein